MSALEKIVNILTLGVASATILVYLQLIGGFYSTISVLITVVAVFLLVLYLLFDLVHFHTLFKGPFKLSLSEIYALMGSGIIALLTPLSFHNTFFGGRDNGVYSNTALFITQHNTFIIKEFVNFPGWVPVGDIYRSAFYLAYPTYLSIYTTLIGPAGIQLSNILISFIGLLALYLTAQHLTKNWISGMFTIVVYASSYAFVWFSKDTFTEMLALPFLWVVIFNTLKFLSVEEDWKKLFRWTAITVSLHFLLLFRGEMVFTYTALVICFFIALKISVPFRTFIRQKIKFISLIYGLSTVPFIIHITTIERGFIEAVISEIIRRVVETQQLLFISYQIETTGTVPQYAPPPWEMRYHFPQFMASIFDQYGLLLVLLTIPLLFILLTKNKEKTKLIQYGFIFFIMLPQLTFLLRPDIALDQPWMLRRFLYTVIPMIYIFFVSFIAFFFKKSPRVAIAIGILIASANLAQSFQFFFHNEGRGFIKQAGVLSGQFTSNDRIFVDQYASGEMKIADPMYFLFQKNTYWLYPQSPNLLQETPREVKKFIQQNKVYIITTKENVWLFDRLNSEWFENQGSLPIAYTYLEKTVDLQHIPQKVVNDTAFSTTDYRVALELIEAPRKIKEFKKDMVIYKLKDSYKEQFAEEIRELL